MESKKYIVTDKFRNHFRYEEANCGLTEKYVYDKTMQSSIDERSIRIRMVAFPNMDTGKIDRVDVNVFIDKNMVFYESHDEKVNAYKGSFSETLAIEFIQDRLKGFNTMLGTSFEI